MVGRPANAIFSCINVTSVVRAAFIGSVISDGTIWPQEKTIDKIRYYTKISRYDTIRCISSSLQSRPIKAAVIRYASSTLGDSTDW